MKARRLGGLALWAGLALLLGLLFALVVTAQGPEPSMGPPSSGRPAQAVLAWNQDGDRPFHCPDAFDSQGKQVASAAASASRPLIYPLSAEPPTLDISRAGDSTSHLVLAQLVEGLYRYRVDGSLEPAGAITYTVSPDSRVYTVTLRSDAYWSDGQPVIAQHYVDGIIRLLDPTTHASYAWLMYVIEGAEEYNTGVITDSNAVGIKAISADTLVFTLEGPVGYFPSIMAMSTVYPVRLGIINSDPNWTEAGHFVSNGPYVLTEWDHGNRLVVEKNPLYHGAPQVSIERVILPIIHSASDQLAAYENDQVDVSGYPASEVPRILTDPVLSAELHRLPRPGVYHLGLNTQLAPTDNISVRKALASAIDRDYIITDVIKEPWREALTSVIPAGILGYQNGVVGYTFNVTQAQDYLEQAGYADGAGFPGVELWANLGTFNEAVVGAVADQWRDNLGITVTTVYTDWGPYLNYLGGCQGNPGACAYDAYRMGWTMDYADASNILDVVFHPDSSLQYTGWDSARYRQLMSLAVTETNQISRTAYFQEADRILVGDEVAVIPLFSYERSTLIKSDITFEYPPFGSPSFVKWEISTVATDTIPPTGEDLTSPDGDICVEFPTGAVTETVVATYTAIYSPSAPAPTTFAFAGNAFTLEATYVSNGQQVTGFAQPLTITINYTDGDLKGQDETTMELRYWNGSEWSTDGIAIVEHDMANNRLVATVEHLTEFALVGYWRVHLPLISRQSP